MPINHQKPTCHQEISHSIIKLTERGSRVKLDIENPPPNKRYLKTKIDGCYIKNQEAADYMLSCFLTKKSLLVELKGNNTAKGCDQLLATYGFLKEQGVFKDNAVPAVLVGTQVRPQSKSSVTTRIVKYQRLTQKKLHIYNRQHKALFESFF